MKGAFAAAIGVLALSGAVQARPPALSLDVPGVAVRDPLIRPAAAGQPTTAAYMTLYNPSPRPVRLMTANCACARMVEPHESTMTGGVMRMRPVGPVVVPPHGTVSFRPAGLHLMLMDLNRPIRLGERVRIRLGFDHARPMDVEFTAAR